MYARNLRTFLRRHLPGLYRPLRRAYAFGEYARWRLAANDDAAAEAYDPDFWDLHADGEWDWSGFAACILKYSGARSVIDVGCGDAKLLAAMQQLSPGLELRGYDGSPTARARAAQRGVAVQPLDIPALSRAARAALAADCASFDLALCLEVAEHLLPWHAGRLLALLTACPTVVFSAAQPGQGGTLHVNERPEAYWIRRFDALGYEVGEDDADFRRALAAVRVPPWYADNAHLFRRRRTETR
ncbi:MAG: class I SAM-dependent methyltransferase [Gemmatimonadaceae bacterium]